MASTLVTTPPSEHIAARQLVPAAVAVFAVFAALAVLVHSRTGALPGDGVAAHLLSHRGTISWDIASFVATVGSGPVVGVIAVVVGAFLVWRHRIVDGIVVVAATATAGVLEVLVKGIVARPRPATAVLTGESGNGFPSGHVSGAAAFVAAVVLVAIVGSFGVRRLILAVAVASAVVVVVAWSRLVVGAHYASDTLGGALLGVAIALLVTDLVKRIAAGRMSH